MLNEKIDLRIQKTHLALSKNFVEMIYEMPYEQIKISELCERAMIQKSTFYKHFANKNELLAFCVRDLHQSFINEIDTSDPFLFYSHLINNIFQFIQENETLMRSIHNSISAPLTGRIVADELTIEIQHRLYDNKQNGHFLPAVPSILAPFIVGAIFETIQYWITNDQRIPVEKLKKELIQLITSTYLSAHSS